MTILETHSTKSQHSSKCPGAGCTDQGCPTRYAIPQPTVQPTPDVEKLVEALECALETMENVDGANDCSRGIDAVEEALAAYRKQGGEL